MFLFLRNVALLILLCILTAGCKERLPVTDKPLFGDDFEFAIPLLGAEGGWISVVDLSKSRNPDLRPQTDKFMRLNLKPGSRATYQNNEFENVMFVSSNSKGIVEYQKFGQNETSVVYMIQATEKQSDRTYYFMVSKIDTTMPFEAPLFELLKMTNGADSPANMKIFSMERFGTYIADSRNWEGNLFFPEIAELNIQSHALFYLTDPKLFEAFRNEGLRNAPSQDQDSQYQASNDSIQEANEASQTELKEMPADYLQQALADAEKLRQNQPFKFNLVNMPFFAGIAGYLMEKCNVPKNTEDRLELVGFYMNGSFGAATYGADYGNSDLGKAWQSKLQLQALLSAGATFAELIPCDSEEANLIADRLVVASRSNKGTNDSPFIKSCSRKFNQVKCACMAQLGRSVYPEIYQMAYSQDLHSNIIKRNPLLGLSIGLSCGIGNY